MNQLMDAHSSARADPAPCADPRAQANPVLHATVIVILHTHCPVDSSSQSCQPLMTNIGQFLVSPTKDSMPVMASFLIGVGATAVLLLVGCVCRRRFSRRLAGQKGMYTFGQELAENGVTTAEIDDDE